MAEVDHGQVGSQETASFPCSKQPDREPVGVAQHNWEDVAAGVAESAAKGVEPLVRKVADDLYERILTSAQDYLADNVQFNLSSRLGTAERAWCEQWERAEENSQLVDVLLGALILILPLAKGYSPAGQTATARATCDSWIAVAEAAIAKASGPV